MDFQSIANTITEDHAYILKAFLVVFVTLLLDYFQKRVFNRLQKRAETTDNFWDEALVDAVRKPLRLVVWTLGIYTASEVIQASTRSVFFDMMGPARDTLIIGSLTWFIVRLIKNGEEVFLKKDTTLDRTTADAISKLLKLSVVITAFLVVLQTLGFSISGVLAFGGIGGIAIGFAARDLLANFFGGLMIYLDRPFVVGEWVRSPDREIEGTVEHIGWRLTRIRTFDKRPLYVPNSIFASIAVENPDRMENRRLYETIGIRYEDIAKMKPIVDKIKTMLENHPEIDTSRTLIVNFNKFAASSLDFFIYAFTRTTQWAQYHAVKQDILLRVIDIIEQEGAEVAFPTSTLHLASGWNAPFDEPGAAAQGGNSPVRTTSTGEMRAG